MNASRILMVYGPTMKKIALYAKISIADSTCMVQEERLQRGC